MRKFLYWSISFPILLCYAVLCCVPILAFTIFSMLIYLALNKDQKELIWRAEKHLYGLMDDIGNLIDSIIFRICH